MRLCTIAAAIAIAGNAFAQTNAPMDNFSLVTNLWYEGHKSNVLAIAEQRLAANSNDLAGLILKMEYNLEFCNDACFSNDISRVLTAAGTVTNGVFRKNYPTMEMDLAFFLFFLANAPRPSPAELEADKAKALIIHKPMTCEDYLKWLHDDGLF